MTLQVLAPNPTQPTAAPDLCHPAELCPPTGSRWTTVVSARAGNTSKIGWTEKSSACHPGVPSSKEQTSKTLMRNLVHKNYSHQEVPVPPLKGFFSPSTIRNYPFDVLSLSFEDISEMPRAALLGSLQVTPRPAAAAANVEQVSNARTLDIRWGPVFHMAETTTAIETVGNVTVFFQKNAPLKKTWTSNWNACWYIYIYIWKK